MATQPLNNGQTSQAMSAMLDPPFNPATLETRPNTPDYSIIHPHWRDMYWHDNITFPLIVKLKALVVREDYQVPRCLMPERDPWEMPPDYWLTPTPPGDVWIDFSSKSLSPPSNLSPPLPPPSNLSPPLSPPSNLSPKDSASPPPASGQPFSKRKRSASPSPASRQPFSKRKRSSSPELHAESTLGLAQVAVQGSESQGEQSRQQIGGQGTTSELLGEDEDAPMHGAGPGQRPRVVKCPRPESRDTSGGVAGLEDAQIISHASPVEGDTMSLLQIWNSAVPLRVRELAALATVRRNQEQMKIHDRMCQRVSPE